MRKETGKKNEYGIKERHRENRRKKAGRIKIEGE